jgi:hypothetical protein
MPNAAPGLRTYVKWKMPGMTGTDAPGAKFAII